MYIFLFGWVTLWPNLPALSGNASRLLSGYFILRTVRKMFPLRLTVPVFFQYILQFRYKAVQKPVFTVTMTPKWANKPTLLRSCTGSAGDY